MLDVSTARRWVGRWVGKWLAGNLDAGVSNLVVPEVSGRDLRPPVCILSTYHGIEA